MTTSAQIAVSELNNPHLPECPVAAGPCCPWMGDCNCQCCCDMLRACEQRMEMRWSPFARYQYDAGYYNGLGAAREAVLKYASDTHQHVGMQACWPENGDRCDITAALRVAAQTIAALQEEGSGNPDNPTSAGKADKPGQFTLDEYEDVKRRAYFAGLNAAWAAISKIPREDGGYCHVLHACDVEETLDILRSTQDG